MLSPDRSLPNQLDGVVIGLDLTAGRRPSTGAALADDLSLHALEELRGDDDALAFVREYRPGAMAIDSPIGLPRGLCCLESDCACTPAAPVNGRACERALSRLGIPSYYTTKQSFIKAMVERAIGLRRRLESEGYSVLEVYPYATKVRLFATDWPGQQLPRKTSSAGKRFYRDAIERLLGHPLGRLNHDQTDALLCAYTAWLWARDRTEPLGESEEGQIHIPLPRGGFPK